MHQDEVSYLYNSYEIQSIKLDASKLNGKLLDL
jgi:hypothetical protein